MSQIARTGAVRTDGRRFPSTSIAGLLAEFGFVRLDLSEPAAGTRSVLARRTDLPALLSASPVIEIRASEPHNLVIRIAEDQWAWETSNAELHAAIDAALRSSLGTN